MSNLNTLANLEKQVETNSAIFLDGTVSSADILVGDRTASTLATNGSSIKSVGLQLSLQSISINYESEGAVSISGTLLRSTVVDGRDEYSGITTVETKTFTLSAIGSYTTTDQGHPSLFVYGVLDKPIGGPAFFFITGLAFGFVYNRRLILPTLDQIPEFPLVQAALSGANADTEEFIQIQKDLQPYIPPKNGQIVLAAGVKFTSFELLESFVLLVATIGDQFALDVLGISTLVSPAVPPKTDPNTLQPPLVQVRLGILARFVPAEGTLAVSGKILPGSYLFDRSCQLSGEFAFYSWFKGDRAGDFVLTVGGYHPRFKIPAHYPRVAPLALNWHISDQLSIKGSTYFALTGSAIMTGGSLEAVWHSGNIKAWFTAKAHFIIAWQPYSYDAQIGVSLGASYTFYFFGRQTISIEVGADLHIWGPEFSGTATINLSVVSFTVRFGSHFQQKPAPLDWEGFRKSFLPKDSEVCTIAIESGLIRKRVENKSEIWIVNPKEFVLNTGSVIPIKTSVIPLKEGEEGETQTESGIEPETNTFGIAPMNVGINGFDRSEYSISIKKKGLEVGEQFKCTPTVKNIPTGLWGEFNNVDQNAKRFVKDVLSGYVIKPAEPPIPGKTQEIERKNLAYDVEKVDDAYRWGLFPTFSASEVDEDVRQENIGISITSSSIEEARNILIQGLGLSTADIDLEEFKTDTGREQAFVIAPQLESAIT